MFLVSCNVELLYTCIDHKQELRAVEFYLQMQNLDHDLVKLLLILLELVVRHNFFLFKDCYYLQLRETAMGATCAPSYANLFLGMWEWESVQVDLGRVDGHVVT